MEKQIIAERETSARKWLRRIWGALPSLFLTALIVVVVMLFGRIQSESKILEEQKKTQMRQTA